jgi:hypothetical protein
MFFLQGANQKFQARRKRGEPMEREQTTIRMPTELMEALRQEALARGCGLNQLAVMILRRGLLSPHFLSHTRLSASSQAIRFHGSQIEHSPPL